MEVFFLAIILVGAAIAGIAIKMFIKPDGMFTKACPNSFDPLTGRSKKCTCRNKSPDDCDNDPGE